MNSTQARALAELSHRRRGPQAARLRSLRGLPFAESADCAAAMLEVCDETTASLRLLRLLKSVNGLGPHRITRLLRRAEIREARLDRKIGELTDRERRVIAAALRAAFPHRREAVEITEAGREALR